MAKKQVTYLTDDLTGEELPEGSGQTVQFTLDNTSYEIDLSKENADKLRDTMAQYVGAARKTGGRPDGRRTRRTSTDGPTRLYDPKIIKRWADSQGVSYPQRGRLPQSLISKFEAHEEAQRAGKAEPLFSA